MQSRKAVALQQVDSSVDTPACSMSITLSHQHLPSKGTVASLKLTSSSRAGAHHSDAEEELDKEEEDQEDTDDLPPRIRPRRM